MEIDLKAGLSIESATPKAQRKDINMSNPNGDIPATSHRLSILNEARRTLTGAQYLHELIAQDPIQEVAIDYLAGDNIRRRMTYQRLKWYAHSLAEQLQCLAHQNVSPSIIPVVMPQCPELYITYLAVLESGAGFCPVLPDTPAERLKFIVKDTDAELVLTTFGHISTLREVLPDKICLPISIADLQSRSETCVNGTLSKKVSAKRSPDDVAYVMYTSGSTGLPKGVKISHRSVTQSLLAHDQHIPCFKRFLQFAAPTFDVSVFEIFFPFFRGATLACCERELMLADLPGVVTTLDVDAAELTPTVAGTLLRRREAAPCLRTLLTIGEMLNKHVVEEFGGTETRSGMLYAMYGPTEAAIHCTVAPKVSASSSVRSIGIPLTTVTVFILSEPQKDGSVRILPFGETGELAIAGQLASGYLNRPDQTTAAFIELPGYGQIYRTGDRATMLTDNTIEIHGRIAAGQVKLKGQRIELGEIEEIACKTAGLDLAVASVIEDGLILFCSGDINLRQTAIQDQCKAWLPRFMRPNEIIVFHDGLPRLPSGKIDRRKLEEDYRRAQREDKERAGEFVSGMHMEVAKLLERELSCTIKPWSSLRACGLESLRAISIAALLRTSFPSATMSMLLESDTVGELCERLSTESALDINNLVTPFEDSEEWDKIKQSIIENHNDTASLQLESVLSCSNMQIAMLAETSSNKRLNFNTIRMGLTENLSIEDVRAAFCCVAKYNQILRTGFVTTDSARMPFAQTVWKDLHPDQTLTLQHPLVIDTGEDCEHIEVQIHHAIYDGWSWDLIVSDVNKILRHKEIPRRPQFHEFLYFSEKYAFTNRDNSKEFWGDALQSARPSTFPHLSPKIKSVAKYDVIYADLTESPQSLAECALSVRISRQTILQAAISLLLGAYCDTTDVIYGVVTSGREQPFNDMENLIGPCLSTIPIRIDLNAVETIRDLLLYIQRTNDDCRKHSILGLSQIKQSCKIPATQKLFDTLCVWQEEFIGEDCEQEPLKTVKTFDALDYCLVLEAIPTADNVIMKLTVDTSTVPLTQSKILLQQIDGIISALTSSLNSGLKEIWQQMDESLLSASNVDFKSCDSSLQINTTISDLATEDPERIAVEFVQNFDVASKSTSCIRLSYGELHSQSTAIANVLASLWNVQPDDLVCIMLEKSIDLYVAILSVIVAGAGYVCIDPRAPDSRVSRIMLEARSKLVISDQPKRLKPLNSSSSAEVQIVSMKSLHHQCSDDQQSKLSVAPDDSLAYAVFTSGSTGVPKGVLITRSNLLNNIDHLSRVYPCRGKDDKLLQSCSQAFDVSVFEIFWTWHMGMTLCTATNDVLFRDLEMFIDNLCVTHLSMTPSVAALVNPEKVPKTKFLVTAGEPMNAKVFKMWSDRGLFQGYGPSETTNICNVRPRVSSEDMMNNVGPAFENTSVFICAKQAQQSRKNLKLSGGSSTTCFRILPMGASGEIWIGGAQVGRSYIDPELTAKSWVEHPKYGRLYKSGDLGRLLADGSLVILGRDDDQIKLRGLRIELGEINSAMLHDSRVKDALTLVYNEHSNTKLVSFVVMGKEELRKACSETAQSLLRFVEAYLPAYMVPDAILPMESLPLTQQGKVDQRNLKELYSTMTLEEQTRISRDYESASDNASLSQEESDIRRIVAEVTGIQPDSISGYTSFYSLGLDSIGSIRLAQALGKNGFKHVDVSLILKNASIKRLCPLITVKANENSDISRVNAKYILGGQWTDIIGSRYREAGFAVEKIMPCTPLQIAMLSSLDMNDAKSYQNTLRWRLHQDPQKIKSAWTLMIERHEILRTVLIGTEDHENPYVQLVLANFELPWDDKPQSIRTRRPEHNLLLPPLTFTIENGARGKEPVLKLEISHAIYDADAMSVLSREVEHVVRGVSLVRPIPFTAYVEHMVNLDVEKTSAFWQGQLHGVRPSRLRKSLQKLERDKAANLGSITRVSRVSLRELEENARAGSLTYLAILQATLARILSCYLKREDVCFGNIFSGRNLPIEGCNSIVGPMFNTLPLRTCIGAQTSIKDLVTSLHDQNLEILPFQPSSLRKIQKEYSPDGQSLFDFLLLVQQDKSSLDESIWTLEEDSGNMSFPMILEAFPKTSSGELVLTLHFQGIDTELANTIIDNFDVLLKQTASFPQMLAKDFRAIEASLPFLTHFSEINQDDQDSDSDSERSSLSALEKQILSIFLELGSFPSTRIKASTSIYRLGLDSISAVHIASRLRQAGYNVRGADVLENPTIEELANFCESTRTTKQSEIARIELKDFDARNRIRIFEHDDLETEGIESIYPCTPTQSGILSQFVRSRGSFYYNRRRLLLNNGIDLSKFKLAWELAAQQLEILRAGFVELEDAKYPFAMVVYRTATISWQTERENELDATARGARAFKQLNRPGWEIVVSQENGVTAVDIWMLHALYDARSFDIILRHVAAAYMDGTPPETLPLGKIVSEILSYSQESADGQKYWTSLGNDMMSTKFPDLSTYRTQCTRLQTVHRVSQLSEHHIQRSCALLDSSFHSVCQIAWAKLLAAYTGQSQVSFGVILSGRVFDDRALNDAAFPCINTVPFSINIDETESTLIQLVSHRNAGSNKFQHIPLSSIKRWNGVLDDLFDTVLVLQQHEEVDATEKLWIMAEDEASGEYAASLEIIPADSGYKFQLTYRGDIIPTGQAQIILEQFDMFVESSLRNAENGNSNLPLDLFSIVPAKVSSIETDVVCLHDLVNKSVISYPQRIALEFITDIQDDEVIKQTWTYSDLDSRSNQIANLLLQHGVKVGELVAVCFDKCPEASFAILGVLKAGCAYVAIDPAAPQSRKNFILDDAQCEFILTTAAKAHDFDIDGIQALFIDENQMFDDVSTIKPVLKRDTIGEDTCYCLYTSGTTGTPKGCMISHGSAVQAMLSFSRIFEGHWDQSSRWLQFASFHFDVSVLEQYWTWSVGICMTSAPRELLFEDLSGTINKLAITHLDLTPSLARLLTPETNPNLCNGVFIVGGEQVSQDILDTWGEAGCLYNFYGPSEVTIGCTVHPRVPRNAKPTNIGWQWDNVGAFVLKPDSKVPVIRGAVGELCLAGPLVGKGYLNRPQLTEDKFITLRDQSERLYRTGDLVRLLHDNTFDFLGRIDGQVKLRGQRLEVGEIDHVIMSVKEITGVSTLVIKQPEQEKEQLVSFFSTASSRKHRGEQPRLLSGQQITELTNTLRNACIERLPPYMVPTYLLGIDFLPLTANNKIDNKVLTTLYNETSINRGQRSSGNQEGEHDDMVQGMSSSLEPLAQLLSSYLGIEKSTIRPSSKLFELGLDSVSVIGFSKMLRRNGFTNATVSTIMNNTQVQRLATVIGKEDFVSKKSIGAVQRAKEQMQDFSKAHWQSVADALFINRQDIQDVVPCTPLQQGMIFNAVNTASTAIPYFASFTYKLEESVSISQLCNAWKSIVAHLSILRTKFVPTEDGYAQVIVKRSKLPALHILGEVDGTDNDEAFHEWVGAAKNFGRCLPWEICFREDDGGARYMSLFLFHGIYDGSSLPLMLDLVRNAYVGTETASNLGPQFHEILAHGPLCQQSGMKEFWQRNLTQVHLLGLNSVTPVATETLLVTKSANLTGITNLSNLLDVTTPAIFHAAWLCTLQDHFKINPTLGLVLSGRAIEYEDVEKVVGPLFNTIPCTISSTTTMSRLHDLIKACHDFSTRVIPYQHSSLRDVSKWVGRDLDIGLFDSLFVFQKVAGRPQAEANRLWLEDDSTGQPDYPLNIEITQDSHSERFSFIILAKESPRMNRHFLGQLFQCLFDKVVNLCNGENPSLPKIILEAKSTSQPNRAGIGHSQADSHQVSDASWTETHLQIRDEFVGLSGAQSDSINYDSPTLFELGLDSIDAMKLAARLKKRGITVSITKIMQNPTIRGVAANCSLTKDKHGQGQSRGHLESTKQHKWCQILEAQGESSEDIEAVLPVTSMQEGLLLDYQNYYHVLPYAIAAGIDFDRLEATIRSMCEQIPILRTRFVVVESPEISESFLQVVKHRTTSEIRRAELNNAQELTDLMEEITKQSTSGSVKDQIPRFVLVSTTVNDAFLLLGLPHAMYDGWSLDLLHTVLGVHYHNMEQIIQPLSTTITFLNSMEQHVFGAKSRDFWRETMKGAISTKMRLQPSNKPRKALLANNVSQASLKSTLEACKAQGVTLQSLGLTCWALVLARNTKSLDITHGLVLSGRTAQDSDRLIYPTFNTVALRHQLDAEMTKFELLWHVHQNVLQVTDHQHFPLKETFKLMGEHEPEVFDSLFTFQKNLKDKSDQDAICHEYSLARDHVQPPYAVNIEMTESEGNICWTCAVQNDVADGEQVQHLFEELNRTLQWLIGDDNEPVFRKEADGISVCGLPPIQLENRKIISVQPPTRTDPTRVFEANWSMSEVLIRDVLAQVAQIDAREIDKTTGFFHLGLDSVSAIKVAGQLRKQGFKISVGDLLKAQSIVNIAKAGIVTETNSKTNTTTDEQGLPFASSEILTHFKISRGDIENILPAAPGQKYMLDTWKANQGNLFYANFWLEATGVDRSEFNAAFQTLVKSVPALRTTFVTFHNQTFAITYKADLQEQKCMPWSLTTVGRGTRVLASLQIHHALYDAVGLHIMIDSLTQLCRDPSTNLKLHTGLKPYLDLTNNLSPEAITKRRNFWKQYLGNGNQVTSTKLRGNFSAKRTERFIPHLLPFDKLRMVLRKQGVGIHALFFASYARIHAELIQKRHDTHIDSVILGLYMANRFLDIEDLDSLVEPTFNILPLKISTLPSHSLFDVARQIQSDMQEISRPENCGASMRDIHTWTGLQVDGYMNFLRLPSDDNNINHQSEVDQENKQRQGKGKGDVSKENIKVTHAEGQSLYDAKSNLKQEAINCFGERENHGDNDRNEDARKKACCYSPYFVENQNTNNGNTVKSEKAKETEMDDNDADGGLHKWCIPAIDVEARVMEDGDLAMGVFAPNDMLNEDEIDRIISGVKDLLQGVIPDG